MIDEDEEDGQDGVDGPGGRGDHPRRGRGREDQEGVRRLREDLSFARRMCQTVSLSQVIVRFVINIVFNFVLTFYYKITFVTHQLIVCLTCVALHIEEELIGRKLFVFYPAFLISCNFNFCIDHIGSPASPFPINV